MDATRKLLRECSIDFPFAVRKVPCSAQEHGFVKVVKACASIEVLGKGAAIPFCSERPLPEFRFGWPAVDLNHEIKPEPLCIFDA